MEKMGVNRDFWRGRRVFLTGHTGFKGGWLSLWLQHMGAEVHGFALPPPSQPSLFEVAQVAQGMASSTLADIRDANAFLHVMQMAHPEVVFHLAAQPLVRQSYAEPAETYATNVMGTVHLFEAVRATPGVRAVVNVTTDKCYENREWVWGYRENEPLGGHDPYSSSKACAELVSSAYRRSFLQDAGIAVATARAGNVIGGGDWAVDRLVPDILRAFAAGHEVRIRNPHAIRPWQHVLEPLAGYLLLGERLFAEGERFADAWNFGPDDADARSVEWIVRRLVDVWGTGGRWALDDGHHPHEANYLKLDISRARTQLCWHPRWDLASALEQTTRWHRAWLNGDSMAAFCLQQIEDYESEEELGP
jgi:CDP-glucose 4,6-dehydratase